MNIGRFCFLFAWIVIQGRPSERDVALKATPVSHECNFVQTRSSFELHCFVAARKRERSSLPPIRFGASVKTRILHRETHFAESELWIQVGVLMLSVRMMPIPSHEER
jgi:hypothetical protein